MSGGPPVGRKLTAVLSCRRIRGRSARGWPLVLSKLSLLLTALVVASTVVAACGGSSQEKAAPAAADPASARDVLIAFRSHREGKPQIYVMNPDGSGQRRLSPVPEDEEDAAWTRDGRRVAFVSVHGSASELVVMNADGTNKVHLPGITGVRTAPTWSPDGQKIAFSSNKDGHFYL